MCAVTRRRRCETCFESVVRKKGRAALQSEHKCDRRSRRAQCNEQCKQYDTNKQLRCAHNNVHARWQRRQTRIRRRGKLARAARRTNEFDARQIDRRGKRSKKETPTHTNRQRRATSVERCSSATRRDATLTKKSWQLTAGGAYDTQVRTTDSCF